MHGVEPQRGPLQAVAAGPSCTPMPLYRMAVTEPHHHGLSYRDTLLARAECEETIEVTGRERMFNMFAGFVVRM